MAACSLSIVFDNNPHDPRLTSLWGFAALLQLPGHTVLFDTGSNGRVLLKNMRALDLDPDRVDLLFLSHAHWDHMGGLDSFLEINPQASVVLHEGFSKHLISDLQGMCGELIVAGREPRLLLPGIYTSGMFESETPEQALSVDMGTGLSVLSGCAHPGMKRIVQRASRFLDKPVVRAIGGFHLGNQDLPVIERTILDLQESGVKTVVPTHCTGQTAMAVFRRAFGERCIDGGAGRRIHLMAF